MKNLFSKFLTLVGGKRGISVIASVIVTGLVTTGRITPQTAGIIGSIAGAVGLVGIGDNFGKNRPVAPKNPTAEQSQSIPSAKSGFSA